MTRSRDTEPRLRLGIDVGGTFTDFVLYETDSSSIRRYKRLSTPSDPSAGILLGMDEFLMREALSLDQLDEIIHATTHAANLVLTRSGARTGLIVTRGFADILELRRQNRPDLFNLEYAKPAPLVPREAIREVSGRLGPGGEEIRPLDLQEVRLSITHLLDAGAESLAVSLLHSYRNPTHERQVAACAKEIDPALPVSISYDVAPQIREYERTSTTVVNAYVSPAMRSYLAGLESGLRNRGFRGSLFVMQSSGGLAGVRASAGLPVRAIESGPAAGAIAAAHIGRSVGMADVVSFDMGGTTAKACMILGGAPSVGPEFEVARTKLAPGSGFPLLIPTVDLVEIGAGGGSIARVRQSVVAIGPDSAGADPGPACYSLGGDQPTVTDANLVLGYIDPKQFAASAIHLDTGRAIAAIEREIGTVLEMTATDAAYAIHETVNVGMERAIRLAAVARGSNLSEMSLMAFGGAGPLHACRLARRIGMPTVVVPLAAGVASALGLLVAPLRADFTRTVPVSVLDAEWEEVRLVFQGLEDEARSFERDSGARHPEQHDDWILSRSVGLRYKGQASQMRVDLDGEAPDAEVMRRAVDIFAGAYADRYGVTVGGEVVEAVDWTLTAVLPRSQPRLAHADQAGEGRQTTRRAFFPEAEGYVDCGTYLRAALAVGSRVIGPAIIDDPETSTVILPGDMAELDPAGNLIIRIAIEGDK